MSKLSTLFHLPPFLLNLIKVFIATATPILILHRFGTCHIPVLLPNPKDSNQPPTIVSGQAGKNHSFAPTLDVATPDSHFLAVTTGTRADWGPDPSLVHPFCAIQLATQVVMKGWCKRDENQRCVSGVQIGETPFFSQVGQDLYLYMRHFRYLKRRGVYAEVATRDPMNGSNTFFMDACLGWKGVCIEANPETFATIHRVRSCELVPTCVGSVDGQSVSFLLHAESGGVETTNKNKEFWEIGDVGRRVKIQCMAMRVVLARRAITTVDYLSLDVEGHELEVLKGFDWANTKINTMTIETTDKSLREIEAFLLPRGYIRHEPDLNQESKRTGLLRRDAVFLHKDVKWGEPV